MLFKLRFEPLGIIPKNQNKLKEMVEILTRLHKYVPQVEYLVEFHIPETDDIVSLCHAKTQRILQGPALSSKSKSIN